MLFNKDIMWFDWNSEENKPLPYEYYREIIEMANLLFGSIAEFTRVFTSQSIFFESIMYDFTIDPSDSFYYTMVKHNDVNYLIRRSNKNEIFEVLNLCNMQYLTHGSDEFNSVFAIVRLIF